MKLSEIKNILATAETVNFKLENGTSVPGHFHVTEVGAITKHFIDCGGTVRNEKVASFQLWDANDYEHRLEPQKLQKIIALSEKVLGIEDLEIEVEYQAGTIGKFDLAFDGDDFILMNKQTACLAKENCGAPDGSPKFSLSETNNETSCCAPGGGCC